MLRVPPAHMDFSFILFWKNELQSIPFPNKGCKGKTDMNLANKDFYY